MLSNNKDMRNLVAVTEKRDKTRKKQVTTLTLNPISIKQNIAKLEMSRQRFVNYLSNDVRQYKIAHLLLK